MNLVASTKTFVNSARPTTLQPAAKLADQNRSRINGCTTTEKPEQGRPRFCPEETPAEKSIVGPFRRSTYASTRRECQYQWYQKRAFVDEKLL